MAAYYLILSGLVLCGLCLCTIKRSRLLDGIFLFISFGVLATMSAIRYDVGFDYSFVYAPIYYRMINDATGELIAQSRWEPGFKLLLRGLMLVSDNFQMIFVVTSILIVFLVMLFFWMYSPNPLISVFLFVTLSHFYCSMNFVRQTLAAAIAMFTLPLLKKFIEKMHKKEIAGSLPFAAGYFAVVMIAASFHMSALLLAPFFFVNLIPINKYVLSIYAVIATAIYFNTHAILEFITRFWYQWYPLDSIHMQAAFSLQFTIAAAMVFLVIFLGSDALSEKDSGNRLYINYAFFGAFFILMGTRHSVIDRLSLPFILLAPVGISIVITELYKRLKEEWEEWSRKKNVAFLAVSLFAVVGGGLSIHHYALTMDHHGVVPYQIVFNQPFYREYVEHLRRRRAGLIIFEEPPIGPEFIDLPPIADIPRPQMPDTDVMGENGPVEVTLEEFLDLLDD